MTTTQPNAPARPLLARYTDLLRGPDPALPAGASRGPDEVAGRADQPGGALVADALALLGPDGLQARRRTVEHLVADDGITYGPTQQPWLLDPLPLVLDAAEWAGLERGLDQRARLLDAVLRDLTGPRTLLHRRVVPADVVAGHAGFLPSASGITLPSRRALPLVAADLVRGADGAWVVVGDRTQAPSGAGYAMANRRITARALETVHRATPLRRLRGWFDVVQAALQDAAGDGVDDVPRVIVLSPGPASETAYDQALLATLLGYPLAQSDDLVMREGRLRLRTTGRLETVDVVLRRVDAAWSDPLDLRADSVLGIPGLVAAARRGAVGVVNPLQASVLENPGLLPHQAAICRALLDEELLLQVPTTWWCGEASARQHVLANLHRLVIKRIDRETAPVDVAGWTCASDTLDDLAARISAEPWAWTAQEPLAKSTAPVVTDGGVVPRSLVLRTFGAASGDQYHFLPGGLARVASEPDAFRVTNSTGATSKDVWVLDAADPARARVDLDAPRARVQATTTRLPGLTPRTASHLFWLGRYVERAETTARLLLVADNLVEDHHRNPGSPGHAAMRAVLEGLTEVTTLRPGFTGPDADRALAAPLPLLVRTLADRWAAGGLAHSVERARANATEVRELLSLDTPSVLSRLDRVLRDLAPGDADTPVQLTSERCLDSLLALAGLFAENLVRDQTWAFVEAGRRIERAVNLVRLLRNTIALTRAPVVEAQVTESVLRVGDSLITYRRHMAAGVGASRPAAAAFSLLLTDAANPRALVFQLDRLTDAFGHAPHEGLDADLRALRARVAALDVDALVAEPRLDLVDELIALEAGLRALAEAIEATHFTQQAPASSFAVAELTAGWGR